VRHDILKPGDLDGIGVVLAGMRFQPGLTEHFS
jgi:hypothetical protein